MRTHRLSDLLTKRRGVEFIATGITRRLLGEHPHDDRDFCIARHGELKLESSGVHDYTEIRLKR